MVERMIEQYGAFVRIVTPDGAWDVPRHYVALHGVVAMQLPTLASRLGFKRIV